MTQDKAIEIIGLYAAAYCGPPPEEIKEAVDMATKAIEQEKYYKDLAQSYERTIVKLTDAIANNIAIDKIRADIIKYESDCRLSVDEYPLCKKCNDKVFKTIYGILDKYKAESERSNDEERSS